MARSLRMKGVERLVACGLFLMTAIVHPGWASAIERVGSAEAEITFRVIHQPAAEVASDLSTLTGVPVTVYGTLKGSVENWQAAGPALAVFRDFGRKTHAFVAFDGARIVMAAADDLHTAVIGLGERDEMAAMSEVQALYPIVPEGSIRYDAKMNAFVIRGPDEFADAIKTLLSQPETPKTIHVIRFGVDQPTITR